MPRKRDDTNDDNESVNSSNGSISTGRQVSKRPRQSLNKSISGINEQLKSLSTSELAREFHDLIRNYRNNNGRLLCECFIRLPAKRKNTDYYNSIKQPIDLIKILQKLKTDEYETFQLFDDDINLLFANALQYYDKDSIEQNDANELKSVYDAEKTKKFESNMDVDTTLTKPPSKRLSKREVTPSKIKNEPNEDPYLPGDEGESEEDNDSTNGVPAKKNLTKKSPTKKTVLTANRRKTLENLNTSINSETSETQRSKRLGFGATKVANLDVYLEDFFDSICSFQDSNQRYLANVFYLLPEAKDYPDYYETIKKPIDLKQIGTKILGSEYKTLKQMEADLNLMNDNAKRYNEPKSIIYKDACKLKGFIKSVYNEILTMITQNKFRESTKTRKDKQKLIQEIAETNHEEFQQLLQRQFEKSHQLESHQVAAPVSKTRDYVDSDDSDEEELEEEPAAKIKKTDNLNEDEHKRSKAVIKSLMKSMWSVFDHIKEFNQQNRLLADPFIRLPSKVLYPDYYEDIKKPVALNCVKRRLNKRLYQTAREFFDDFELIFKNAMQYNVEESLIYKDAKLLLNELVDKRKEHSMIDTVMVVNSPKTASVLTPSKMKKERKVEAISISKPEVKALNLNLPIPKFNDLKEKLVFIYNYINDFQHEGRDLAPPFKVLPSRVEYPDYYNVIKKPIDMNKILNKINHVKNNEFYTGVDDLCLDFAVMFENACNYNEPASTLYKDALNLQRALYNKRDEIVQKDMTLTSTGYFGKDPINDFQKELEFIKTKGYLTGDFIENAFQSLIEHLFEQCMQFQDMEGRTLSESFLDLYSLFEEQTKPDVQIFTFEMIKQRVYTGKYKRMDSFQDEMFQVFNQIRINSYLGQSIPVENSTFDKKIHRYSQLFRDAYDLQRYFIQKRDEVCSNGELLQTNALSFKTNSLDQYITSITNSPASQNFDEADILMVEKRYVPLEKELNAVNDSSVENSNYKIGDFYYLDRVLVKSILKDQYVTINENSNNKPLIGCLLSGNTSQTNLIFQIYLKNDDIEFFAHRALNTRRTFDQEVFKTDLYANINGSQITNLKQCVVVGVKEHISNEHIIAPEEPPKFINSDIFVCESIYSTFFKFFRKIQAKKWSPLVFINSTNSSQLPESITPIKRSLTLLLSRSFINQEYTDELFTRVNNRLSEVKFHDMQCETIAFDSPPAIVKSEKGEEDYETHTEDDSELMKKSTYYEQVLYKEDGELYKLGDYVYIKNENSTEAGESNENEKTPMIVRIDRLWSIKLETTENTDNIVQPTFFIRGALFLRPTHVEHEPTRLFYKNEVFKETSKEITTSLDQIVVNKVTNKNKCSVMNSKMVVSSRLTEIDERDVYICEARYSLQLKTFRKFNKGLRKFQLSIKCNEDEVYFLRHELQLHKHMSPRLASLFINYDEEMPVYEPTDQVENQDEDHEEDWSDNGEPNLHDENSSHSFVSKFGNENGNSFDVSNSPITPSMLKMQQKQLQLQSLAKHGKKVRVKRLKKCGYNIFSKEFRKSLRDTKSSLSFIDMSKEVGNRWRALTVQARADYESKAERETIIEAQKMAAEQAAKQAAEQAALQTQNTSYMNQQNVMVLSSQNNGHAIQMVNNQMYLTPNTNIINNGGQQQVVYMNQSQNGPIPIQAQQYIINNPAQKQENAGPMQVQHKEAYVKYIAKLRKQEQAHMQPAASFIPQTISVMPDWFNSLDIRASRIKESKVGQPPNAWIENVASNDVMQHLLSLRYNLLEDAVNINKSQSEFSNNQNEPDVSCEENESIKEYSSMETCVNL